MLDDFFTDPWFSARREHEGFKLDVQKKDKEYLIEAELPGVKKEEISLEMNDGTLTISVNREESKEEEDKEKNYIHKERRTSSMSRSVYVGDADAKDIHAKLDNGVLKVTLPMKAPAEKTSRIEIE